LKFRIIPTILTDGTTVVKGKNFNNWRTVGSAVAMARLFASRDVDELIFLDVTARHRKKTIDIDLITKFSNLLSSPFTVGGGIDSVSQAASCLRSGAEKVILGSAAYENPKLVGEIADKFGNQAVVVAVDLLSCNSNHFSIHSGSTTISENFLEYIQELERLGAGEIMLQCKALDGEMKGLCLEQLKSAVGVVKCPIVVSSGAASPSDYLNAYKIGAAGVAAGAIFQFTQLTPKEIRESLRSQGVPVRNS
jgi:cyclase